MPRRLSEIDRHVGKRIRAARILANLSLDDLGQRIGVSYQQVQKYENGTNRVGAGRLHQIATALRQPLHYFYAEDGVDTEPDLAQSRALLDETLQQLMRTASQIRSVKLLQRLVGVAETIAECERLATDGDAGL
jgi:transcriptional regulator with XRE-family HTH domain